MKKAFLIVGAIVIISGVLSGVQYKQNKEYIDSLPVYFEEFVSVPNSGGGSSAPAEEVPVFTGACS